MHPVHTAMTTCVPTAATGAVGNSTHTDTIVVPTTANNTTNAHNNNNHHSRCGMKPAEQRLPPAPPRDERPLILAERFHTRLCKSFRKSGTCEYGAFCMFAHGKARLRTVDANVRDGLTTTEAIRAWQRARAAEAAAEELKLLPLDTATVGRVEAEYLSVGAPPTAENSASELPSALHRRGHGPIAPDTVTAETNAGESPVLPSSAHTLSTARPNHARVYRHDPYRLRVTPTDGVCEAAITMGPDAAPRAARAHTFQHRPYSAVPVSLGPLIS